MNLIREACQGYMGRTFLREAANPLVTDTDYLYAADIDRENGFTILFIKRGMEYVESRRFYEEPIRERFREYASSPFLEIPISQYALCA